MKKIPLPCDWEQIPFDLKSNVKMGYDLVSNFHTAKVGQL